MEWHITPQCIIIVINMFFFLLDCNSKSMTYPLYTRIEFCLWIQILQRSRLMNQMEYKKLACVFDLCVQRPKCAQKKGILHNVDKGVSLKLGISSTDLKFFSSFDSASSDIPSSLTHGNHSFCWILDYSKGDMTIVNCRWSFSRPY